MKKILMILTKDRRDCVDINLRLHERAGSFEVFDQIVFLLNDVSRKHMRFIDSFMEQHPKLNIDKIIGDGTRPRGISDMQNRCIAKYPDAFYAKTDEDVFVPDGWAQRMIEAYEVHKDRDDLALITPLLPNNAYGLHFLLTRMYPAYLEEYRRLFGCDPSIEPQGLTWHSPTVGEWATRKFIDIERANKEQRTKNKEQGTAPYHYFSKYFSIGCIGYDYRHWKKMGGIPWNDEPGWCKWIEDHHQMNVLDCRQIALHYTFFVQQQWLDRTRLLEDIRRINFPDSVCLLDRLQLHRAVRLMKQIPVVVRRRLSAILSNQK